MPLSVVERERAERMVECDFDDAVVSLGSPASEDEIAAVLAELEGDGDKAYCPTGPGGGQDNSCSPHGGPGGVGKRLDAAIESVMTHTGYTREQLAEGLNGDASSKNPLSAKMRARVAGSVLLGKTAVKDAALHVMDADSPEDRKALIKKLMKGDAKESLKQFADTPIYDLEVLGGIVQHPKPIPGQAVCKMQSRVIEMGSDSVTGTYRHELGHAVRSMLGGESFSNKTQITKAIAAEYDRAMAKVKADGGQGLKTKLDHESYELKYGVAGRRSLDNFEENFAEHYRLYHREIYKDKHEGGGGKFLKQYRERHPEMANIFDAHYTAAMIAQRVKKSEKSAKAFCPTGEGGGIDNSCSPHGNSGSTFESSGNLREDLESVEFGEDTTPEVIQSILDHHEAEPVEFGGQKLKNLYLARNGDLVEWDGESNTFTHTDASDVSQWVYENNQITDQIIAEMEDRFNDDFWSGPPPLYHATQDDNVEGILSEGIEARNMTRGMSNRNVGHSVYTTSEYEEALGGSYGNNIFEIDTAAMKKDQLMPYVSMEPDVIRGEALGSLAHALGVEDFAYDSESGMSPSTVVVNGNIPAKYLKLISDPSGSKAFCPTGPGGGIDNSCGRNKSGSGGNLSPQTKQVIDKIAERAAKSSTEALQDLAEEWASFKLPWADERRNTTDYSGMKDETADDIKKRFDDALEKAEVVIVFGPQKFVSDDENEQITVQDQIAQSDKLKNLHEAGRSTFVSDPEIREAYERNAFEAGADIPDADRPKYGTLAWSPDDAPLGDCGAYGGAGIVLDKSAIKGRATISDRNSSESDPNLVSPLENPYAALVNSPAALKAAGFPQEFIDSLRLHERLSNDMNDYVEVQVWGDVKLDSSTIKHIQVQDYSYTNKWRQEHEMPPFDWNTEYAPLHELSKRTGIPLKLWNEYPEG